MEARRAEREMFTVGGRTARWSVAGVTCYGCWQRTVRYVHNTRHACSILMRICQVLDWQI